MCGRHPCLCHPHFLKKACESVVSTPPVAGRWEMEKRGDTGPPFSKDFSLKASHPRWERPVWVGTTSPSLR